MAYDSLLQQFLTHCAIGARVPAAIADNATEETPDQSLPGIAVIPITGIIGKRLGMMETMCGGYDLEQLYTSLAIARSDPSIHTIILHADTPGGAVTGVPEMAEVIYEAVQNGGKLVLGYTDTLCASAGYYLLSQCHQVFAAPSSLVGSIGVVTSMVDRSKADAMAGISYTTIKSGAMKDLGNPHRPATSAELEAIQANIDAIAAQFFSDVQRVRGIDPKPLEAAVFSGADALEKGLVDGLYPTLDALIESLLG